MARKTCPLCHGLGSVEDGRLKLSAHQKAYIVRRLARGESGKALAKEYGVTESSISRIRTAANLRDGRRTETTRQ